MKLHLELDNSDVQAIISALRRQSDRMAFQEDYSEASYLLRSIEEIQAQTSKQSS